MITKIEDKYLFWMCNIPNMGVSGLCDLYEIYGSAQRLYEATDDEISRLQCIRPRQLKSLMESRLDHQWEREYEEIKKRDIKFISYFHEQYPKRLKHIYQPPKRLMVKGDLPSPHKHAIAIVGARNATSYGRDMARMFGYRLAKADVQVISGMAYGVDGWGHQGALEGGGDTYAILGSGVEICYPASHKALYHSIQKHGGVISEFPIFEGARAGYFPLRNRIISGLSDGILVVEAREKSGSLITADAALEQGKDVFVIPGRIGDELSVGCNRLIRQGAIPVLAPDDILEYYDISVDEGHIEPEGVSSQILSHLSAKPVHIDSLAATMGMKLIELDKELLHLKKQGLIEEVSRGYFAKR